MVLTRLGSAASSAFVIQRERTSASVQTDAQGYVALGRMLSLAPYISPAPDRLNGNTFRVVSLPSAAARRCADHASRAERFSLCPIMPLINPDYASPASAQMIQHRLGDFQAHAKALQASCERSAQVMQPPTGNIRCPV
jgi:hypothetical protein